MEASYDRGSTLGQTDFGNVGGFQRKSLYPNGIPTTPSPSSLVLLISLEIVDRV